jgi:glutathione S-transferase
MDYVTPSVARGMPGVRLALTLHAYGPWGQAVKKMLEYKGVSYVPVSQTIGEPNEDLVAWTGCRNAPIIIADDAPPAVRWLDQIMLIENLQPTPPLLPRGSADRALTIGIVSEIAGEAGFGWARRLMLFDDMAVKAKAAEAALPSAITTMVEAYGSRRQAADMRARAVDIVSMLATRLKEQRAKGSRYLVGAGVTAADIYWACFSPFLEALPDRFCRVPEAMQGEPPPGHHARLGTDDPAILAVKDPILSEHRDMMFENHLGPCWV